MKKRIMTALMVLVLVFSLAPEAFADTIYSGPGAIEAGRSINHLAATLSSGGTVSATDLPPGIILETENGANGLDVYLRGVSLTAGTYNCFINIGDSDNKINYPITIVPATPVVNISSPQTCFAGAQIQLSVSTSVNDGGSLSYQWYYTDTGSTADGVMILNATDSTYYPDTTVAGTTYYYCEVTNTNNGASSTVLSGTCSVTVREASVTSISVASLPNKIDYKKGESLNSDGLQISINYSDGSSQIVSSGFGISPSVLEKAGTQTIIVTYQDKTCSFSVNVEEIEEKIDGIGVLTPPAKTEYKLGESFDSAGLSIRVYTNLGQRDVSEGFEISPKSFDKPGDQTVTISYGGKTCTLTVKVKADEKPVSLSVLSKPSKLTYLVGEELDTKGLTLRLTLNNNKTEKITEGFSCSPTKFEKAGPQEITVTYGELSCKFSVNVKDKKAEASPSPSPSAKPGDNSKPDPSPSVAPDSNGKNNEPHKSGLNHTPLIVIMVVALVALGGLGAYAYYMSRNSDDDFIDRIKEFFERFKSDKSEDDTPDLYDDDDPSDLYDDDDASDLYDDDTSDPYDDDTSDPFSDAPSDPFGDDIFPKNDLHNPRRNDQDKYNK